MYSTTIMCDMVYYIVSGLFLMFFWCPCMAINLNKCTDSITVGFSPTLYYTADPMLFASGNPFKCHEEVLYLQPLIPPTHFDISPPLTGGCSVD